MPQAKILLYGAIGYDWWSGVDNTAQRFIADFNAALADSATDEIAIHINSVGGDVHEGLAIYNAIKASTKPTVTIIDGIAYSMGAIIALAANTCKIANNGLFMLHNVSGMDWGNAKSLRTTADVMDKYDNQLAVSIAAKTGLTVDNVKSLWLNYEDNYFTAQEAKAANLVDALLDEAADLPDDFEASAPVLKLAAQLGNHYKPKQNTWFNNLVNQVRGALAPTAPTPTHTPENLDIMKISAKLTALAAFFGLQAAAGADVIEHQPTEEQLTSLDARLTAAAAAEANATALQAQLDAAVAERTRLTAEVERLGNLAGAAPTAPAAKPDVDPAPTAKHSWEIEREALLAKRNKQ